MSQYDDPDRPDPRPDASPSAGGAEGAPGSEGTDGADSADGADGADQGAFDDTQPLHRPAPGEPGPWAGAYGTPTPTAPQPVQAPAPTGPAPDQGSGYGSGQGSGRPPGWMWPVIAVLALVVGALGGVLGGVAVSSSMSDDPGTVPLVAGGDTGAAKPLAADNGSISAVAAKLLPSTVQIQANGGAGQSGGTGGATGSGFVLDSRGHVITNNHVVADATGDGEIKVVDQDGTRHAATIVGRSPVYDIAVLAVDGARRLQPAALGSSQRMRVGDTVVAIGSPLGLSSTVTSGIVSAIDRPVTTGNDNQSSYINAVQTDAAINPGNSGGPLVNMRGQVVGVNSAIATTGGAIGGESGNIGVGFAIPMEQVRITASQILATGEARYPVIGANVNTGSKQDGAQVVDVQSGTPAARAGLEKGDVVTRVDGTPVNDGIGLIVAIRSHQPGETVTLTVRRGADSRRVDVRLDSKVG